MKNNFWLNLKTPFTVLAPMEEVTDIVFRQMVASCARPDVFFTEFTSADGLCSRGKSKVIERLIYDKSEHPIVAQIWGNRPENIEKAAGIVEDLGFDGVDINMGCPVKKVVRRGECAGLIGNYNLVHELILAAKEGAKDIAVSVKTRLGNQILQTEDWASFLLEQNLDAITFHARIAKEFSKKPADWNEITKVVKLRSAIAPQTVIIGNGDVKNYQDAQVRHKEYQVEGIMIGRGIFEDLFCFDPNKSIKDLTKNEKMDLLLRHSRNYFKQWGRTKNYNALKKFYKIYISGFHGALELKSKLMRSSSLLEVEKIVKNEENKKI